MTDAPKPTWAIRAATVEDIPQLVQMQLNLAKETEGIELDAALLERGIRRPFEKANLSKYFVADCPGEAGKVAGMLGITYEWSDWRCGSFYWIESVYTLAQFRGQGIFTALYDHVKGICAADPEACGLRLYVEDDNEKAQAAYVKMGMEVEHYRMMKWTKDTKY